MAVVLHGITAGADAGTFELDVSVDGVRATFGASVSADGGAAGCDQELFFLLSERGLAERGSSTQYHADLCLLLLDMQKGTPVKLPFSFGTDRRFPSGFSYQPRPWWRRLAFWRHPAEA